jgi:methionyl aminopeptidase
MTVGVGAIPADVERLLETTSECLELGIEAMKPGARLSSVSRAIQEHAESRGYGVVRQFVGHGIGRSMHEQPQVPNFVPPRAPLRDVTLREGDALALEPMLNAGTHECEYLADGWTVVTRDRKLSAHFEHTVALHPEGRRVLTR